MDRDRRAHELDQEQALGGGGRTHSRPASGRSRYQTLYTFCFAPFPLHVITTACFIFVAVAPLPVDPRVVATVWARVQQGFTFLTKRSTPPRQRVQPTTGRSLTAAALIGPTPDPRTAAARGAAGPNPALRSGRWSGCCLRLSARALSEARFSRPILRHRRLGK